MRRLLMVICCTLLAALFGCAGTYSVKATIGTESLEFEVDGAHVANVELVVGTAGSCQIRITNSSNAAVSAAISSHSNWTNPVDSAGNTAWTIVAGGNLVETLAINPLPGNSGMPWSVTVDVTWTDASGVTRTEKYTITGIAP